MACLAGKSLESQHKELNLLKLPAVAVIVRTHPSSWCSQGCVVEVRGPKLRAEVK